jgi:hypothetical protein
MAVTICKCIFQYSPVGRRFRVPPSAAAERLVLQQRHGGFRRLRTDSVLIAVQPTGVPSQRNFAEQLRLYTKRFLSPLQPREGPHELLGNGGETMLAVASTTILYN